MKIYESDDRGDKFVCGMREDWVDPRPLAKVIRFRGKRHDARMKICGNAAKLLTLVDDRLSEDLKALKAGGVWREFSGRRLPPDLRTHPEAKDPALRVLLLLRRAVARAAWALLKLSEGDPVDE